MLFLFGQLIPRARNVLKFLLLLVGSFDCDRAGIVVQPLPAGAAVASALTAIAAPDRAIVVELIKNTTGRGQRLTARIVVHHTPARTTVSGTGFTR